MKSKLKKLFAAAGILAVFGAGISFHAADSTDSTPCYKCGPNGEPDNDPTKDKRD